MNPNAPLYSMSVHELLWFKDYLNLKMRRIPDKDILKYVAQHKAINEELKKRGIRHRVVPERK